MNACPAMMTCAVLSVRMRSTTQPFLGIEVPVAAPLCTGHRWAGARIRRPPERGGRRMLRRHRRGGTGVPIPPLSSIRRGGAERFNPRTVPR